MFEIWWKDRLIDVVPVVRDVPEGLTVKSRASGPVERVRPEEPDWRFPKLLAFCLLAFVACVMVMTLTPVSEGGFDDGWAKTKLVTSLVLPPAPPKSLPKEFTSRALQQIFAGPARPNQKVSVGSVLAIWDSAGPVGSGLGVALDALGELKGGGPGADGSGLGGPRGPGPGGPGNGFSLGGGPIGKRPGPGGSNLGPKRESGPTSGPVHITDGLDRALVAKVIRAHANEIKYCYERELQHTPGLSGKVSVSFTIGPAGDVIEAGIAESTLANEAVEACMLSRVKRWKFPEPQGGGTVDVNHPWIFRGAGDNDP